jgi:hypothetical protein
LSSDVGGFEGVGEAVEGLADAWVTAIHGEMNSLMRVDELVSGKLNHVADGGYEASSSITEKRIRSRSRRSKSSIVSREALASFTEKAFVIREERSRQNWYNQLKGVTFRGKR